MKTVIIVYLRADHYPLVVEDTEQARRALWDKEFISLCENIVNNEVGTIADGYSEKLEAWLKERGVELLKCWEYYLHIPNKED